MQQRKYELTALAPLLMHNNTALDPFNAIAREMKKITGKRTKTDEDLEELARLEWRAGLYYDKKTGPYIPGINLERTIQNAARLIKRGKDVERGLSVLASQLELKYSGPRGADELFAQSEFRDMRAVGVQRRSIMRCRPRFEDWSLEPVIVFLPEIFNAEDVDALVESAGEYIGLCDYRPRFGRFAARVIE